MSTLTDISVLKEWSSFVSGILGYTGNQRLIESFDWGKINKITVGDYLDLLDFVEDQLADFNWSQLKPQLGRIEDLLKQSGLMQAEINITMAELNKLANGDYSIISDGIDYLRAHLSEYPDNTALIDIIGDSVTNTPTSGDDVIIGTPGDDNVDLGDGHDAFWAGSDDVGNDVISGGAGNDVIGAGPGNDTVNGGAGNDAIFGGVGNDELNGDAGADVIWGGSGEDKITGGSGDDVLGGGDFSDIILAGLGADIVYAGADKSNDTVDGGAGDDILFGGGGNDQIIGGAGDDQMYGGAGNDTFIFKSGFGNDSIGGFETNGDNILDLSALNLAGFGALRITQKGADAVIDTGHGTITLWNTNHVDVTADDFLF